MDGVIAGNQIELRCEIEVLFEKFLAKRGCFSRFKYYLERGDMACETDFRKYLFSYNRHRDEWVANAFQWDRQPEGVDYWMKLSDEWEKLLRKHINKKKLWI